MILFKDHTILINSDIKRFRLNIKKCAMCILRCTHEREDEDITQMTVFNDSKQGRAKQGKADTDRNTGE